MTADSSLLTALMKNQILSLQVFRNNLADSIVPRPGIFLQALSFRNVISLYGQNEKACVSSSEGIRRLSLMMLKLSP